MNPSVEALVDALRYEAAVCADPWTQVDAYIAADETVDAAIREEKCGVLACAAAFSGRGQDLAARAFQATRSLGHIGAFLSEGCEASRGDGAGDDRIKQVILAALANYGASIRWSAMQRSNRSLPPYTAAHELYLRAEKLGIAHTSARIVRDGEAFEMDAEAHYLRNLLLPLICEEPLDPQQLEIVDRWLWDWLPDFQLTREVVFAGPRLWVDLGGRTGASVRQFMPEGEDVRHVDVSALALQIRETTASLEAARIPGSGCSVSFPMSAHIGVRNQFAALWDKIQDAAPDRRHERVTRVEPLPVEALIGLPDILQAVSGNGIAPAGRMQVHDESEGGAGLLVEESLWRRLADGDLVGIRFDARSVPHVGVVVRRFSVERGDFAIGVEWLARAPRALAMSYTANARGSAEVLVLHAHGENALGRADAIILAERQFLEGSRYELDLDDGAREVRLDHALRRGRGWVCAGYRIAEEAASTGAPHPQEYMCKPPFTARLVPVM